MNDKMYAIMIIRSYITLTLRDKVCSCGHGLTRLNQGLTKCQNKHQAAFPQNQALVRQSWFTQFCLVDRRSMFYVLSDVLANVRPPFFVPDLIPNFCQERNQFGKDKQTTKDQNSQTLLKRLLESIHYNSLKTN